MNLNDHLGSAKVIALNDSVYGIILWTEQADRETADRPPATITMQ